MNRFAYHRPTTLAEALQLQAELPGAQFVAGGTDLLVRIKSGDAEPKALISLRNLTELHGIQVPASGDTVIGAATPIAALIAHQGLAERYPVLIQAASRLGSAQIRNAATIGGNLCNCSPCADTATPLLVLDARVRLADTGGERELPLADFIVGPGQTCSPPDEVLTAVVLPEPSASGKGWFEKKGRVRMDLAIASVCAWLELDGQTCTRARLAAGSSAPVPLRLTDAEAPLEGQKPTPELAAQAGQRAAAQVSPISDLRASEAYRRHLVGVYVQRAIARIMGWSQP